jgi:hypothetical protein
MMIERLEARRLLTTIQPDPNYTGYYAVIGTEQNDNIEININGVEGQNSISVTDSNGFSGTITNAIALRVQLLGGDDWCGVQRTSFDQNRLNVHPTISGGPGDDWIQGQDISAWGDEGHDWLLTYDGYKPELWGGPGDDTLTLEGAVYDAWIYGDDGNDVVNVVGVSTYVRVQTGEGDDEIALSGGNYRDEVSAGNGIDTVWGAQIQDNLYGVEFF